MNEVVDMTGEGLPPTIEDRTFDRPAENSGRSGASIAHDDGIGSLAHSLNLATVLETGSFGENAQSCEVVQTPESR